MTLVELLRRLDEEASKAPWLVIPGEGLLVSTDDRTFVCRVSGAQSNPDARADAALIATLRTLLPAIIAELEAGRAAIALDPPDHFDADEEHAFRAAIRHSDEEARRHE